jgi:hypothetical protein
MICMTDGGGGFFSSLSGCRFWVTLLWAMVLAVVVTALDWAEGELRTRAAALPILMVPEARLGEDARRRQLESVTQTWDGVRAAWLSPADQATRISRRFPDEHWRQALDADDAWLPWVLQVWPADPLGHPATAGALAAWGEQQAGMRVFWDNEPLARLVVARRAVWWPGVFLLALVLSIGAVALGRLGRPAGRQGFGLLVLSAIFGAAAPAAVWSAAWLAGVALTGRSLALAMFTGLVFAAAVAPMLRERRPVQR